MTRLRQFLSDRSGAHLAEFAVVMPVMLTLLLGIMDLSYREYAIAMLQGSVQKAARDGTLQLGATSAAAIDQLVMDNYKQINKDLPSSAYTFTRRNFSDFTSAGKLEPANGPNGRCAPAPGSPAAPYTFTDVNGNGEWDDGGSAGQGGADDAVLYTVSVQYKSFFPVGALIGLPERQTITASTVLRNQPYANQNARVTYTITMTCPQTSSYY